VVSQVFLIDNSPTPTPEFKKLNVRYIFTGKNSGYGMAHNIALRESIENKTPFHLVVNPDISFDPAILANMIDFLNKQLEIGLLMPKVLYPDGEIQYLCKLIPTPLDLIFRRFFPTSWTKKRRDRFEMRASGYNKIMDVPYLSGCFMLLRTEALKEVGLFDERFFMYPEDIDLTRRIHGKFRTVFYPEVSVVHQHAHSSYLNLRMLMIHTLNMIKYFNKWGWFFDEKRKQINEDILKQFD
jgi:GT2 family glycosyltransferase